MNLVNSYGYPSLVATIAFIALAAYVLWHNPKRTQNQVTALLFLSLVLWSLGDALKRFAGPDPDILLAQWDAWMATHTSPPPYDWNDYGFSIICTKIITAGVILISPTALHFSLVVPRKRRVPPYVIPGLYGSYLVMLALLLGTELILAPTIPYYAGWGTEYGPWMLVHFTYVFAGVLSCVILIAYSFIKAQSQIERNQTKFVLIGIVIAVILNITMTIIPLILHLEKGVLPPVAGPGSLMILAGSMAYSIGKYKLFEIEAVTEEVTDEAPSVEIEQGFSYIFAGTDKTTPYKAFRQMATQSPGLCITVEHPRKVRGKYALEKTPVLWLTSITTGEKALSPWRLDFEIVYTINTFMHENRDTVVLLDGVNYLSVVNGQDKTVGFLTALNDVAASSGSTLIVPLDQRTLGERELSMFRSTMDRFMESHSETSALEIGSFNKLVLSDEPEGCYTALESMGRGNRMCISKTYPDKLRKMHGLEGVKMYWLSDSDSGDSLSPTRMEFEVTQAIVDFFEGSTGGKVVLDGLSKLILDNGFSKTLDFIKTAIDLASEKEGVLLVHLHPEALKPEEMAQFEGLFDVVERV